MPVERRACPGGAPASRTERTRSRLEPTRSSAFGSVLRLSQEVFPNTITVHRIATRRPVLTDSQAGAAVGHYHAQIRSSAGLALIERFRGLTADLPEVEEAIDKFGHTSFRVRDKPFVILGEQGDQPSLSLKSDRHTQRYLIEHTAFVKTPYIGQHGWVTLDDVDGADWDHVEQLVRDGYRLAAPKSLARRVE